MLHAEANAPSQWVNIGVSPREGAVTASGKLLRSYSAQTGNGILVPLPAGDYVLTIQGFGSPVFDLNTQAIALSNNEAEWNHDEPGSTYKTAVELKPDQRLVDYVGADDVSDTYGFTITELSYVTIHVDDVAGYTTWQVFSEARNQIGVWTSNGLWQETLQPGRYYVVFKGETTYGIRLSVEALP